MKRLLKIVCLGIGVTLVNINADSFRTADGKYKAEEAGTNLIIITPGGKKVYFGDIGLGPARNYKLEVPLDQLDPGLFEKNKPGGPNGMVVVPGTNSTTTVIERAPAKSSDDDEEEEEEESKPALPPEIKVEYDETDRLILQANHYYNRRKYYEATLLIEQLLEKKPALTRAWIMKGSLMYIQGQKDLARKAWEQALKIEPENKDIKGLLEHYR